MARPKSSGTDATGAPPDTTESRKPGDIELSEKALDQISGGHRGHSHHGSATITAGLGGAGTPATISAGGSGVVHSFGQIAFLGGGSATIIGH